MASEGSARARVRSSPLTPVRIEEIAAALSAGATTEAIDRQYAAKWGCSERTIQRARLKVRAIWRERELAGAASPVDRIAACHEKLGEVYRRALADKDYRTAARIIYEEARMFGAYPSLRVELAGRGGGPIEIADGRAALLDALEKIGADSPPARALLEEERRPTNGHNGSNGHG